MTFFRRIFRVSLHFAFQNSERGYQVIFETHTQVDEHLMDKSNKVDGTTPA